MVQWFTSTNFTLLWYVDDMREHLYFFKLHFAAVVPHYKATNKAHWTKNRRTFACFFNDAKKDVKVQLSITWIKTHNPFRLF